MLAKTLLLGRSGTPVVLLADGDAYADDGELYDLDATTDRLAPAGAGGEVAWYTVYVAVTYDGAFSLAVTPIVDGAALDVQTFALPAPAGRESRVLEIPVRVAFPDTVAGFATLARFAPRGTWLQTRLQTQFAAPGVYVCIDGIEAEIEIVREAKQEGVN